MKIDDRDLLIAWSLLPFLTPNRSRLLFEYFDPISSACNASSTYIQGLLSVTREQADEVRNPLHVVSRQKTEKLRDSVIVYGDDSYPSLLREIIDPPLALHVLGNRDLLSQPAVAVVGSRRASPYGVNAARQISQDLARSGLAVVSGLARGIDSAAHEAALDARGATIAVLGTGIDVVYPRSNAPLFRRIAANGVVLSEFPPGTPPLPEHFPMRNRVISGLTSGTVIVEATSRSGSLITARMAAEQGREVFAVPGSIFSKGSEGTHRLIQYGAKLVHDVDDVLQELPGNLRAKREKAEVPESPLREVLDVLSRDEATHVDSLAAKLCRPAAAVCESLLQLELEGWIQALPGARYVRVK